MSRSIDKRLGANMLVRIRLRHACERRRVHQLGDRRAPDARIGILSRHLQQQIAFVERKLLHELQARRGVGVLVTGMGAESIEQCHTRSSLTSLQGAVSL